MIEKNDATDIAGHLKGEFCRLESVVAERRFQGVIACLRHRDGKIATAVAHAGDLAVYQNLYICDTTTWFAEKLILPLIEKDVVSIKLALAIQPSGGTFSRKR